MQQIINLQRRQQLAECSAAGAICEMDRQQHDALARAYEKIIAVLKRDRFETGGRRVRRT